MPKRKRRITKRRKYVLAFTNAIGIRLVSRPLTLKGARNRAIFVLVNEYTLGVRPTNPRIHRRGKEKRKQLDERLLRGEKAERIPRGDIRLAKNSRQKAKEIADKLTRPKKMWRLTVACNYVNRHVYGSFKVQSWSTDKRKLEGRIQEEAREQAIRGVEKFLRFKREELFTDKWLGDIDENINVELEEVPYRERLDGRTEAGNEPLK